MGMQRQRASAKFEIGGFRNLGLMASLTALLFMVALPASAAEGASQMKIDPEASVFAVVTHKAGLAARLAHNHLVVAGDFEASLGFDPENPKATTFRFEASAAQLTVDDPAAQSRWYARIAELGILSEPFGEVSEGDRAKIHKSMVGKKQLDVERHPKIRAEIVSVTKGGSAQPEGFPFSVRLRVEIVGKSVEKTLAGRFEHHGGRLAFEAFGEFAFTDFGIEPYSAMLGAVKNDDPFHIYVFFEADQTAAGRP